MSKILSFLVEILPTLLSLLDKVPFKGFRTLISGVGLTAVAYLGVTGHLDPAVATALGGVLATSLGYFAASH